MRRTLASRPAFAAALLAAALLGAPARAGTSQVQVELPVPERIDMAGIESLLVTRLVLLNDNPKVDLNREMTALLRKEFRKKTPLRVVDVEPPPLPEQSLDELVRNAPFWRDMGEKFGSDLILTASLLYEISDRSGFVQEDIISPVTGQRVRRSRYAEREGFEMTIHLYFLRGRTGELVFDDTFREDTTVEGRGNDPLAVLFGMFEHIEPDVLGIVSPRHKVESRTLFTD